MYSYGRFGEICCPDLGSLGHYYLTSLQRSALSIKIQRFEVKTLRKYKTMYVHIVMSQEIWIFMETAVRAYKSRTFHQFQYIIAQAKFLNTLIAGVTFLREKCKSLYNQSMCR